METKDPRVLDEIVKLRDVQIRKLKKEKESLLEVIHELQTRLAVSEESGRSLARLFIHYNQEDGE